MELLWKTPKKELKKDFANHENRWTIPERKEKECGQYFSEEGISVTIKDKEYSFTEPRLSEEEKITLLTIKNGLYELLNFENLEDTENFLKKALKIILTELDLRITEESQRKILFYIHKEFIGFGEIEALKKDPLVDKIFYNGESIQISHRIYGKLSTNIILEKEKAENVIRRIIISYQKEIPEEYQDLVYEDKECSWKISWKEEKKTFLYTKKRETILSPIEIIRTRKASPEIFSYLWMLMEDKKNIFVNNTEVLYALSFFLPQHVNVSTNTQDYPPNELTTTNYGTARQEEFSFIKEKTAQTPYSGTLITTTEEVKEEEENIICYTENKQIVSIKEEGQELFAYREGKFCYNLDKSHFMNSKGNKALMLEEWKKRTKLLTFLTKNKTNNEDFKRIIAIYYQSPESVLKKAGLQ